MIIKIEKTIKIFKNIGKEGEREKLCVSAF